MSEGTESKGAESGESTGAESTESTSAESAEGTDEERVESADEEGVESKGDESAESKGEESAESRDESKDDESAESKGEERAESKGDEKVDVKQARLEIAAGDATAVDVRSEEEWGKGHIPGAIHLPNGDPENAAKPLEKGERLLVIAEKGKAAVSAAKELAEKGYNAGAVEGGMKDWISEDYPVQPTDDPDDDTELGTG